MGIGVLRAQNMPARVYFWTSKSRDFGSFREATILWGRLSLVNFQVCLEPKQSRILLCFMLSESPGRLSLMILIELSARSFRLLNRIFEGDS